MQLVVQEAQATIKPSSLSALRASQIWVARTGGEDRSPFLRNVSELGSYVKFLHNTDIGRLPHQGTQNLMSYMRRGRASAARLIAHLTVILLGIGWESDLRMQSDTVVSDW